MRVNAVGTVITAEACAPIVPLGILIAELRCKATWEGDLCQVEHPTRGTLPIVMSAACPEVDHDLALELIKEIENKRAGVLQRAMYLRSSSSVESTQAIRDSMYETAYDLDALEWLRRLSPEAPEALIAAVPSSWIGDIRGAELPLNRRVRRQVQLADHVVLHLYAGGTKPREFGRLPASVYVLSIDASSGADMLSDVLFRYLCNLCHAGKVKAVIGGPPWSTFAVHREMGEQGGAYKVIRAHSGTGRFGLREVSSANQSKLFQSNLLYFRQLMLYHVASVASGGNTMFALEGPQDPKEYRATCVQTPSLLAWPEVKYLCDHETMWVASFQQGALGHEACKPTSVLTNSWELYKLVHGLTGPGAGGLAPPAVAERMNKGRGGVKWAPGLCHAFGQALQLWVGSTRAGREAQTSEDDMAIATLADPARENDPALKPLTSKEAEFVHHCQSGHVVYRKDCAACLGGMLRSHMHLRAQHPQSNALVLSLDLIGPWKAGEDHMHETPVRHILVGTLTVPVYEDGRAQILQDPECKHLDRDIPDDFPSDLFPEEQQQATWDDEAEDLFRDETLPEEDADDACPDGDTDAHDKHERFWKAQCAELQRPVKVHSILFAEPLTSKKASVVLKGIQRMYAQIRLMNLSVRRVHSDQGREFNNQAYKSWAAARDIAVTYSPPSDPKGNGRIEAHVGLLKGGIRTLLQTAPQLPTSCWPHAVRQYVAQRLEKSIRLLGGPGRKRSIVPFGTTVTVRKREWSRKTPHDSKTLTGVAVCPSAHVHGATIVRLVDRDDEGSELVRLYTAPVAFQHVRQSVQFVGQEVFPDESEDPPPLPPPAHPPTVGRRVRGKSVPYGAASAGSGHLGEAPLARGEWDETQKTECEWVEISEQDALHWLGNPQGIVQHLNQLEPALSWKPLKADPVIEATWDAVRPVRASLQQRSAVRVEGASILKHFVDCGLNHVLMIFDVPEINNFGATETTRHVVVRGSAVQVISDESAAHALPVVEDAHVSAVGLASSFHEPVQGLSKVSCGPCSVEFETTDDFRNPPKPGKDYDDEKGCRESEREAGRLFQKRSPLGREEVGAVVKRALEGSHSRVDNVAQAKGAASLTLGAWVHYGLQGVTRQTAERPWLTRLLNRYVAQLLPGHRWSAVQVTDRFSSGLHRDLRNQRGSLNAVVPLSASEGGRVWTEEISPSNAPLAEEMVLPDGSKVVGTWSEGSNEAVVFDARGWHLVEGVKRVAVAYTPRALDEAVECERTLLDSLGFRLPEFGGTVPQHAKVNSKPPEHKLKPHVKDSNPALQQGPTKTTVGPEDTHTQHTCRIREFIVEEQKHLLEETQNGGGEVTQQSLQELQREFTLGELAAEHDNAEQGLQSGVNHKFWAKKLEIVNGMISEFLETQSPAEVRLCSVSVAETETDDPASEVPLNGAPPITPQPKHQDFGEDSDYILEKGASAPEVLLQTRVVSQQEVWSNLEEWRAPLAEEVSALKVSHQAVRSIFPDEIAELEKTMTVSHIPAKGVYTQKAVTNKLRARIVGCGNFMKASHNNGQDEAKGTSRSQDLYASGLDGAAVRIQMRIAAANQWQAGSLDIRTAFLTAPLFQAQSSSKAVQRLSNKAIIVTPPKILQALGLIEENEKWLVLKALYGLQESPSAWAHDRDAKLAGMRWIGACGVPCRLQRCVSEENLWKVVKESTSEVIGLVGVYVDDLLLTTEPDELAELVRAIQLLWKTSDPQTVTVDRPMRFCGFNIFTRVDGSFILNQEDYVRDLLAKYPSVEGESEVPFLKEEAELAEEEASPVLLRKAQAFAGAFQWLTCRSRPDIAFATNRIAQLMSRYPRYAMRCSETLLRYLRKTASLGIRFGRLSDEERFGRGGQLGAPRTLPLLEVFADASFAPGNQKSQSGIIATFASVPIAWISNRQATVSLSSAESELNSTIDGVTLLHVLAPVLEELLQTVVRKLVYNDNVSCVCLFTAPSGVWRTRHLRLKAKACREQLQEEMYEMRHLVGQWMLGDLCTKAVPGPRLRELCMLLGMCRPDLAKLARGESDATKETDTGEHHSGGGLREAEDPSVRSGGGLVKTKDPNVAVPVESSLSGLGGAVRALTVASQLQHVLSAGDFSARVEEGESNSGDLAVIQIVRVVIVALLVVGRSLLVTWCRSQRHVNAKDGRETPRIQSVRGIDDIASSTATFPGEQIAGCRFQDQSGECGYTSF
eukprot:s4975_g3.t1